MRWILLERYNPPASALLHFIKGGGFEKLNAGGLCIRAIVLCATLSISCIGNEPLN
jgi:hypothetical protein